MTSGLSSLQESMRQATLALQELVKHIATWPRCSICGYLICLHSRKDRGA